MPFIEPLEKPGTATPIEKTSKARKASFLKLLAVFVGCSLVAALTPKDSSTGESVHKIIGGVVMVVILGFIANAVMGWWERG